MNQYSANVPDYGELNVWPMATVRDWTGLLLCRSVFAFDERGGGRTSACAARCYDEDHLSECNSDDRFRCRTSATSLEVVEGRLHGTRSQANIHALFGYSALAFDRLRG